MTHLPCGKHEHHKNKRKREKILFLRCCICLRLICGIGIAESFSKHCPKEHFVTARFHLIRILRSLFECKKSVFDHKKQVEKYCFFAVYVEMLLNTYCRLEWNLCPLAAWVEKWTTPAWGLEELFLYIVSIPIFFLRKSSCQVSKEGLFCLVLVTCQYAQVLLVRGWLGRPSAVTITSASQLKNAMHLMLKGKLISHNRLQVEVYVIVDPAFFRTISAQYMAKHITSYQCQCFAQFAVGHDAPGILSLSCLKVLVMYWTLFLVLQSVLKTIWSHFGHSLLGSCSLS